MEMEMTMGFKFCEGTNKDLAIALVRYSGHMFAC
jgi:hypothetical protein